MILPSLSTFSVFQSHLTLSPLYSLSLMEQSPPKMKFHLSSICLNLGYHTAISSSAKAVLIIHSQQPFVFTLKSTPACFNSVRQAHQSILLHLTCPLTAEAAHIQNSKPNFSSLSVLIASLNAYFLATASQFQIDYDYLLCLKFSLVVSFQDQIQLLNR